MPQATVALINAAGGQAIAIGGDVTREADVAAMVARTVSAFGRIDCAFNNAGIAGRAVGPAASARMNSARRRSTPCWRSI
jgi:NAD(P)-dependent dehydrogenase (short-subunit alcohol dehydrogenase family)